MTDTRTQHGITVSPRTVVESCFDGSGDAELAFTYDVGLACGLTEQAVRLAIRRLADAGLLRQTGRGRRGALSLTAAGRTQLIADTEIAEFAFSQDRGELSWDGLWRIHTFSVPETARTARSELREALVSLGAAALAPGVYVTPHDLRDDLARLLSADARSYLYTIIATSIDGPGFATEQDAVEHLWPSEPIRAAYAPLREYLDAAHPHPGRDGATRAMAMARALQLIEGLANGLVADPLLPPELLPAPWEPRAIRSGFLVARDAILDRYPDLPAYRVWR